MLFYSFLDSSINGFILRCAGRIKDIDRLNVPETALKEIYNNILLFNSFYCSLRRNFHLKFMEIVVAEY